MDWDNKEEVMEEIGKDCTGLLSVSSRLRDDKEVILEAIKSDSLNRLFFLSIASDRLRDDPEVVLAAVRNNGGSLKFASPRLKNDESIVLEAVKMDSNTMFYASDRLRDDDSFILRSVAASDGFVLVNASERLKESVEFALKAITQDEKDQCLIDYFGSQPRLSKEVVLASVKKNGDTLSLLSDLWRNDKEVVLEAAKQSPSSFEYASDRIKDSVSGVEGDWDLKGKAFVALCQKELLQSTVKAATATRNVGRAI